MAHYIFNVVANDAAPQPLLREQAVRSVRARLWGIDEGEPHRDALAAGDLVLVYVGAPERMFIARVELASAVHVWTRSEAQAYPGKSPGGVVLAQVEEWEPPVPMDTVLSRLDPIGDARADFDAGVVLISANEYETAVAVSAGSVISNG